MPEFIPVYQPDLSGHELEYVSDCVTSGWISSLGKYVERFEAEFARFCAVRHAVALANGTVAVHLALEALGIGPGDEVLVPALTFVASANAVVYCGARPVFIDSDPATWTMDAKQVEARLTPRSRAILPVHLYGHPADMDALRQIAQRHALFLIEDAAEAHGARVNGAAVGGLGDAGCFSFYGNKIITTGEGGMLTTNDDALAQRARFLKDHAMLAEPRYYHPELGYNYRMTNIQAAIGLAQLERIEDTLAKKRRLAQAYARRLQGLPGVQFQPTASWADNVFWMVSIVLQQGARLGRDALMAALRERGIDTRPFFIPLHRLPMYASGELLPVAEYLGANGINLPSYPALSEAQVERICAALWELLA